MQVSSGSMASRCRQVHSDVSKSIKVCRGTAQASWTLDQRENRGIQEKSQEVEHVPGGLKDLPDSLSTCRTTTPVCSPAHSRPDTRVRLCPWTLSTCRRMTSPVDIITPRQSVTRRRLLFGTPSTLPAKTIPTASRGQVLALGRWASAPWTWAARPLPHLQEAPSAHTTSSLDRRLTPAGGEQLNPSDPQSQVSH